MSPYSGCPTCQGTGIVSNCSPMTCDGSHVSCINDDCPDCADLEALVGTEPEDDGS